MIIADTSDDDSSSAPAPQRIAKPAKMPTRYVLFAGIYRVSWLGILRYF